MLAIRMQRTGRKGHASFRVVVQDSRQTPTSGRVVAQLGTYDPHTKAASIDKEKANFYLEHGAQPSDRAARLMKKEGVTLPAWVNISADIKRDIKNVEKLRKNRPAEAAAPAEETASEASADEAPAAEEPASETPAETAPEAEAATEAKTEEPEAEADKTPEAEAPAEEA
jgi:small subunit ribosomal protein S16